MGVGEGAEFPSWFDVVRSSCTSMLSAGCSSIVLLILVMIVAPKLVWFSLASLMNQALKDDASVEVDPWQSAIPRQLRPSSREVRRDELVGGLLCQDPTRRSRDTQLLLDHVLTDLWKGKVVEQGVTQSFVNVFSFGPEHTWDKANFVVFPLEFLCPVPGKHYFGLQPFVLGVSLLQLLMVWVSTITIK